MRQVRVQPAEDKLPVHSELLACCQLMAALHTSETLDVEDVATSSHHQLARPDDGLTATTALAAETPVTS